MQIRTVQVGHVSDLATEREIHEFFSFSGDIDHIEIRQDSGPKTAFVTFKDPQALEIGLLLSASFLGVLLEHGICICYLRKQIYRTFRFLRLKSESHAHSFAFLQGATIVDQIVSITPAENYVLQPVTRGLSMVDNNMSMVSDNAQNTSPSSGRVYVSKAQDVVSTMLAKGSAIRQDAVNKARAFDEKHQLRANASARVNSFDKRVGLTEKLNVGISVMNEKVKSVDQRLQVSDTTMAALMAAERKLNDTGSAVKSSRYVIARAAWLNGAFGKVAKVGQVAGSKTREKWSMAVSNLTAKDPPIAA